MTAPGTSRVDPADPFAAPADGPEATQRRPGAVLPWLERFGLFVVLAGIAAVFSLNANSGATFRSTDNLRAILAEQAVPGILALAFMLPLVAHEFDLSVGSIAGLSSIVTASLLSGFDGPLTGGRQIPVAVALLAGVLLGAAIGAVNGVLVTRFEVSSLIATLGTATIISGLVTWHTEGVSILAGVPRSVTTFGIGRWAGLPRVGFVLAVVAASVWYLLEHTPYGRYLISLGSSRESAALVGIPVRRVLLRSFVGSGGLAGVAGALLMARQGGGVPSVGPNLTLAAIAAAFLGMTTIRPGRPNAAGTVLGVFFVAVLVNGLVLAGSEPWVESVVTGSVLLVAVGLSSAFGRRRGAA